MKTRINWAPYILVFPSMFYLFIFFGFPMIDAVRLAFQRESEILELRESPNEDAGVTGKVPIHTDVAVTNLRLELRRLPNASIIEGYWYYVLGEDELGNPVEGWTDNTNLETSQRPRINLRSSIVAGEDQTATLYRDPGVDSQVIAELPDGERVRVYQGEQPEDGSFAWYQITASSTGSSVTHDLQGWIPAGQLEDLYAAEDFAIDAIPSRVISGSGSGEWTLSFFERMVNDSRFAKAIRTTVTLMIFILPIQFVLAIIMALILQSQIRGSTIFLYIYAIPLGVSDLAAGLVWYSIFTQSGFINSILFELGLIDNPHIFIGVGKTEWMILIVVLAEVWRATSIVMVIVVSGLQAIPKDYMEAGELFGANLWQRLRHIILPMLKPSLQVALILRTILAFQVFAVVIAITGGEVMTVLANETYRWYDPGRFNNPNMAAAYATFIMVLSLGFSMIYLRTVRSQVEEQQRK